MSPPKTITLQPFKSDNAVGLVIPVDYLPLPLPPGTDAIVVRFKSADGFKAFMVAAMDAASVVWPDIAAEWQDA